MSSAQNVTGSKYEATKALDLAVVAKLVRADIKAAVEAGALPAGLVCSVRVSRYSGGQSLDVRVTAAPFVVRVADDRIDGRRAECIKRPWLTEEASAVLEAIEAIREAYNYDRSDLQTDYFNVRFYGDVSFDVNPEAQRALRIAQIEARIAEIEVERARLTAEHDAHIGVRLTLLHAISSGSVAGAA